MTRSALSLSVGMLIVALMPGEVARGQAAGGTIKGHIRLSGKPPGNPIIRMGMDPMCVKVNGGKRVVQETVVATADGSLANVFVSVQGSFPQTAVPSTPVVIDQRGCMYTPRVVGARVGQILQVRNSDELVHNVHSFSSRNPFNLGQPTAGMVQPIPMKAEDIMLSIKCDVHRWMSAYVGVVSHPYFAVTDAAGNFEISNLPAGTRQVQIWHEQYGLQTKTAQVKAGATATLDFAYSGDEKPPAASLLDPTRIFPEHVANLREQRLRKERLFYPSSALGNHNIRERSIVGVTRHEQDRKPRVALVQEMSELRTGHAR